MPAPITSDIPIAGRLYDLFLRFISLDIPGIALLEQALTWLLDSMHDTLGLTWVLGIALLASLLRLVFAPLTIRSKRIGLRMIAIRPLVARILVRHPDDRTLQSKEMGELLDGNRISIWQLVLPMVLQIPIFMALYRVMLDAAATEPARIPLFGDLSVPVKDGGLAGVLLVVVMAVTQVFAVRLLALRKEWWFVAITALIAALEVPFTVHFPIGVILFVIVTQALVMVEHWVIMRHVSFVTPIVGVIDDAGNRRQETVDLARAWRDGTLEQVAVELA